MPAAIFLSLFLAAAPPPLLERGDSRAVFTADSRTESGTVALTIDDAACPAADAFSLALVRVGSSRKASLQLDRRAAARLRELAADAGRYQLTIAAAGCRPLVRDVVVASGKRVVLGVQSPRSAPHLTGRIVDDAGKPFAGAAISSPEEKVLALSDLAGRFSADPGEDWPSLLKISAPGFAEAVVAVPAVRADAELPPVALGKGSRLELSVDRASAGEVPLTIRLFRLVDRQRPALSRTAKLAAAESTRAFDALAPGDYLGELAGPSPFQRFVEELTVKAGEPAQWTVKLAPTHLRASAVAGAEPLANAESTFRDRRGLWTAMLHFDASGRADTELWQGGTFSVVTTAPGMPSPNVALESIAGDAEVDWTLRIATSRVSGIVVDEAGTPVAAAHLWLRTDTPDGVTATLPATTDSSGRFTFSSVAAGAQSLEASAEGFLPADPIPFTLDDARPEHEARVVLRRGAAQELDVTTAAGAPIAGATVIPWTAGLPLQLYATDAAGHVRLQLPAAASTVFVFPREGSFAIAHPRPDGAAASASLPIVVPDGTASIELDAKSLSGAPIPDVIALMRVNGDLFPPDVLESLRRTQGVVLRSGSDGRLLLNHMPPGLYEFWPHGNLDEANAILANLGDAAPVQLAVRPGPNLATLTFRSAVSP